MWVAVGCIYYIILSEMVLMLQIGTWKCTMQFFGGFLNTPQPAVHIIGLRMAKSSNDICYKRMNGEFCTMYIWNIISASTIGAELSILNYTFCVVLGFS